ncbi:MAG: lipocalin family protein [Bacteroidota bacterium]
MKRIFLLLSTATTGQQTVNYVDLNLYAGKWYVVACIPTVFDRNWEDITETYTVNPSGSFNIYTSFRKPSGRTRTIRSKAFIDRSSGNARWKVQFVWPLRAHYWIIELADDYSYTVVGHPKKKFLYIMSRSPFMKDELLQAIIGRCSQKGYDISELRMPAHHQP